MTFFASLFLFIETNRGECIGRKTADRQKANAGQHITKLIALHL